MTARPVPAAASRMRGLSWIYIGTIALIIFLANTGRLGPVAELIRRVPYGDAVLHALLMGVLAVAVNVLLNGRTVTLGRPWLAGSVLVLAFVIIEEFTQIFIANRTFSLIDLGADFVGIGIAGRIYQRRSQP